VYGPVPEIEELVQFLLPPFARNAEPMLEGLVHPPGAGRTGAPILPPFLGDFRQQHNVAEFAAESVECV